VTHRRAVLKKSRSDIVSRNLEGVAEIGSTETSLTSASGDGPSASGSKSGLSAIRRSSEEVEGWSRKVFVFGRKAGRSNVCRGCVESVILTP
jgi:hypothetical protein